MGLQLLSSALTALEFLCQHYKAYISSFILPHHQRFSTAAVSMDVLFFYRPALCLSVKIN